MRFSGLTMPACSTLALVLSAGLAAAQQVAPLTPTASGLGAIVVPKSSLPVPNGAGRVMHTNFEFFVPAAAATPQLSPYGGNYFETPASLACMYRLTAVQNGCVPHVVTTVATGGSRMIAVVDAFDNPVAASNLDTFSKAFGLPAANFKVVYANGTKPPQDPTGGWETEEALDVEVTHALAPNAQIVLVEAASDSATDLLAAVDTASNLVAQAGGGEVTMSWGSDEVAGLPLYDGHFKKPGVVYFASTGDSPGVEWPSTSSFVVAVGGTTIARNAVTGVAYGQTTWSEGGGGASAFIASPAYQQNVRSLTGAMRAVPDISAVGNPNTGVLIYVTFPYEGVVTGWAAVGGTSASSPIVAALTNASGTFRASSVAELTQLYANAGTTRFKAITKGTCGPYGGYEAVQPWNPCVGLGTPLRPEPF